MKKKLESVIQSGNILLGDGATGSRLIDQGLTLSECPEVWNITRPETVKEIHKSYFDAGSDFVTSNTFGGNRKKLEFFNHHDKVVELNTYGIDNVNSVKPEGCFCFASMGSTGNLLQPYGELPFEEAFDIFSEQARIFADAGADAILIETMIDTEEAYAAAKASLAVSNLPVIVSFTFNVGPFGVKTMMGASPSDIVYRFEDLDILALGSNCGCGIEDMIKIIKEFRACTYLPLIAQANAGMPEFKDGKNYYKETPDYMGEMIHLLLDAGANILGGCCGTNQDHISRFKKEIREWKRKS
jgi:5-methyltetrahydrofolate--homocysteine methyltransferase